MLRFLDTDIPFRKLRDVGLKKVENVVFSKKYTPLLVKHGLVGYDTSEVIANSAPAATTWDVVMISPFDPEKVLDEFKRTYKSPAFVASKPNIGTYKRSLFNFDGRLMESGTKSD